MLLFQFKDLSLHGKFYFSGKVHPKNSLYLIQHKPNKLCHCNRAGHNPKISQQLGLCVLYSKTEHG